MDGGPRNALVGSLEEVDVLNPVGNVLRSSVRHKDLVILFIVGSVAPCTHRVVPCDRRARNTWDL